MARYKFSTKISDLKMLLMLHKTDMKKDLKYSIKA